MVKGGMASGGRGILFDLDDTLIARRRLAVELAFTALILRRVGHWGPPWRIWGAAKQAIRLAKGDHGLPTNQAAMVQGLASALRLSAAEVEAALDEVAERDFPRLAWGFSPVPGGAQSVSLAAALGLRLGLATNPTTPEAVVRWRLRWLGLEGSPWAHLTHAANSRHVKPHPEYFLAVAQALGLPPGRCLMVGDDPQKDGGAQAVGMAFWRLRSGPPGPMAGDHEALQAHLRAWVEEVA